MKNNRWLIIIGLGIFIMMCSIASFSVGVYVGEHGWTKDGVEMTKPEMQRNNQQQPNGPQALQPQQNNDPESIKPGLPPGRPQVIGKIQRISNQAIDLITKDGPRQITFSDTTNIQNQAGNDIRIQQLNKGDNIAVFGTFTNGDGKSLQAEIIIKIPTKDQ